VDLAALEQAFVLHMLTIAKDRFLGRLPRKLPPLPLPPPPTGKK
jgi:hypothetical protein